MINRRLIQSLKLINADLCYTNFLFSCLYLSTEVEKLDNLVFALCLEHLHTFVTSTLVLVGFLGTSHAKLIVSPKTLDLSFKTYVFEGLG